MKYRNTIVALIILVLLGSYIYFFETKPVKNTESGKPTEPFIAQSDSEHITRIEITKPLSDKPIVLERNKEKVWELQSPIHAKTDKLAVDNLIKEFKDLVPTRIIDGQGLDLASYGLDTPKITIILAFDTKKNTGEKILVGTKTPNAEDYYVKKTNEPKLYLIPVNSIILWSKEASVFRDKTVFTFDSDKIVQLDLHYPKKKFGCNKEQGIWWVTKPEKLKANQNKLDDLLWKLQSLAVNRFVDEQPLDLAKYGLTNPQMQIRLKSAEGKVSALNIGKSDISNGALYAKTADNSYIFSLDTAVINELNISSIAELRDRSVLTFDSDSITRIELKYPDKTMVVAKEQGQWWMTQPKRIKADASKLDDLLWRLSGLSIIEFGETQPKSLNKYGLDKPSLIISLQSNNQKLPELSLGNDDIKKHLIYAQTSDKNFIFQIDDSILHDLKATVIELSEIHKTKP
ncbi:MAG: DUF4340 domain-containing protein [bacterium]